MIYANRVDLSASLWRYPKNTHTYTCTSILNEFNRKTGFTILLHIRLLGWGNFRDLYYYWIAPFARKYKKKQTELPTWFRCVVPFCFDGSTTDHSSNSSRYFVGILSIIKWSVCVAAAAAKSVQTTSAR